MASLTKHEILKDQLLDEIVRLPSGTRLPTVKEMMSRYQVSQATVDRALGYLKEKGYVSAQVGRGTFTCEMEPASRVENVDLVLFGSRKSVDSPSFHRELIEGLSKQLGEQGRWLRVTVLPYDCSVNEARESLEKLSPQGLILVNLSKVEIVEWVREQSLPHVLLFPDCRAEQPNSVLIDNRAIVRQWIEHLTQLGHRHIAYLHSSSEKFHQRDQSQRLQFFYEEMGRAGLLADPDLVLFGGYTRQEGLSATESLLARGKPFSAIICGDNIVSGVYEALKEAGREVGDEISVIGVDDCTWAAHLNPPLTTVRIARESLAALAVDKLQAGLASEGGGFQEMIQPQIVVRESTRLAGLAVKSECLSA
jgi:DNA-binding LacI/PurR family transcriptional regulator